jgi:hypothetical protein
MGCDIVSWVEVYLPETHPWKAVLRAFPADSFERTHDNIDLVSPPFRTRNYGLFGVLAGVRNYSCCEPLAKPRGLPDDCDVPGGCLANEIEDLEGFHSYSWFLLSELLSFDYERVFWNRRIRRGKDGAALAQEGDGVHETYRNFLGQRYMDALDIMKGLGDPDQVRVIFCFGD